MSVLKLVTIDLRDVDLDAFEAYERQVVGLLARHGGELRHAWRTVDGVTEMHVLSFAGPEAFEAYLADPARIALQDAWRTCGARATVADVSERDYGPFSESTARPPAG